MSQKSSVPQAVKFVSQALKRDNLLPGRDVICRSDRLFEQLSDESRASFMRRHLLSGG
jgi:hypothetical protein